MSNNYFNFTIPAFQDRYGEDWDDFNDIIEDNTDYLIEKTIQLKWLVDPNYMTTRVVEMALKALDVDYSAVDTLAIKKNLLRKFLTSFEDKSLDTLYLDYAEDIVGTRGTIYSAWDINSWRWDYSRWHDPDDDPEIDDIKWTGETRSYFIFIDVKTTDSSLLDDIVDVYRLDYLLPAFHKIFLIDSDFNVLRTV